MAAELPRAAATLDGLLSSFLVEATTDEWVLGLHTLCITSATTLLAYFLLFGARHRRRRRLVEEQVRALTQYSCRPPFVPVMVVVAGTEMGMGMGLKMMPAAPPYMCLRVVPSGRLQLLKARARVAELERELRVSKAAPSGGQQPQPQPQQAEVRIWMDGAFDMLHYGHM
jgi:hypothetical protein